MPVWFELSVQVSPDPNPHPNLTLVLSLAPPLTCPAGSSAHSSCSRRQGDDRTKTPLPTLAQVVQDKPAANEALLHMQRCCRCAQIEPGPCTLLRRTADVVGSSCAALHW